MKYIAADIYPDKMIEAMLAASLLDTWSAASFSVSSSETIGINPLRTFANRANIEAWIARTVGPLCQKCSIIFNREDEEHAVQIALRYGGGIQRVDRAV